MTRLQEIDEMLGAQGKLCEPYKRTVNIIFRSRNNAVRYFWESSLFCYKCESLTTFISPSRPSNTVHIIFVGIWQIVVDDV